MAFVNSYEYGAPSHFNRVIQVPGAAGRYLAVGGTVEGGLAALVAPDGSSIWSRLYPHTPVTRMDFVDGIAVAEGFLLLSAEDRGSLYTLVRVDNDGAVLWCRAFPEVTRGPGARVLRHPTAPNEFLVAASPAATEADYGATAKLFRVGADGKVLQAVRLTPSGRMFDIVTVPDGFVLVGDGPDERSLIAFKRGETDPDEIGRFGLVAHVDTALTTCRRLLIAPRTGVGLSLRAAIVRSGATLLVAGCVDSGQGSNDRGMTERSTLVGQMITTQGVPRFQASFTYALSGDDQPGRIQWCPASKRFREAYDVLVLDYPRGGAGSASVFRLDQNLAAISLHKFDLGYQVDAAGAMIRGEASVDDLQVTPDGKAAVAGWINPTLRSDTALLLGLDPPFECCKTLRVDPPRIDATFLALTDESVDIAAIDVPNKVVPLRWVEKPPQVTRICGGRVEIAANSLLQSPYLNLQAAGSDGSDSSRGILLRWFLAGTVGDSHLPKGGLATSTINFNKPDDYVRLYRAPWPATATTHRLRFAADTPCHVDDDERLLVFETSVASLGDLFHVRFADSAAWQSARQQADPLKDPAAFLAAYGSHPVEIELRGRLAIGCDVEFAPNPGCSVKVETRSVGENRPLAPKQTTSRRILGPPDGPKARLYAENLRSLRIQCAGTAVTALSFLCYEDLLRQLNADEAWTEIGRFALTDDSPTALARLEDSARFQVEGKWRKYNDGAFVNVANYVDRWTDPQAGLRAAVRTYVQLSETDPSATAKLPGSAAQDGKMKVSYLDLLQLAATDFHMARMLGLGHVDADAAGPPGTPRQTWVYLAEYRTAGDLGDGSGARPVQHLYMSLPTSPAEFRLPVTPLLNRADYGLTVTTASGDPHWLTDAGGYTPDGTARYIRLYPDCPPLFEQEKGFFDPPNLFDLSRESLPVFFGVEHRLQGEPGWRRPEIAHDPHFVDTAAQAEARPAPFGQTQTARPFPHKQTEPGVHEYAVYGVNLFSRASPTGPAFSSGTTTFVKANRLLPPSDLQVQFIQPESPLVLTSADEQKMLDDLVTAGKDPTLVRLCFNYGFPQEANYEFGHAVEIFHRRTPPANVTGSVAAAAPATDPSFVRIETGPFTYPSTGETIQPTLPSAAKANFLGGVLAVGSRRLIIEDIIWPSGSSGDNPVFLVRRPTTTGAVGEGSLVIQSAPLDVNTGDLFMAVENMAAAASWGPGNPLGRVIALGDDPSWKTRTESFTRPDQTLVSRLLRGIWESAKLDEDPAGSKHYTITFASYTLAPHPQSAAADPVDWFRGVVRAQVTGRDPEDRRMLKVIGIGQSGGLLELRAVDDSGEAGSVATGPGRLVHYLPGYRVHLHADPASGFDQTTLMPVPGEGSRTTLLGARSVDPTTLDTAAKPYRSPVGVPQLLTAMEIIEPGIPLRPKGLKYATPPDSYGKASYTLNVEFEAAPFAVAYYRADALAILEALYEPEQQAQIRAAIFPAQADPYFANRFDDLFAFFDSDDATTDLALFPLALGDNYFLPLPNAASLGLSGLPTLAERKQRMKAALLEAFVALTEQPLIYELISTDPAFVPTNAKQVFRNADGEILAPGQAGFDLAPMAKRPGGDAVQFTDFTLEGSMNRDTVYFYLARELGNRMQLGEPSPIFGPVLLVNLTAPAAPQLRKIGATLYDEETTLGPEVLFDLLPPSATDPMARLLIYRASSARDALSVRTMRVVQEIDVATLIPAPDGILTAADDFRNEPFIPFGEPLYYRLAWVREVHYEDAAGLAHTASVVSEPTATLLANLVDVVNPPAPVPAVVIVSTVASTGEATVELKWPKTTHNGTYYVCQLSPSGNWFRLAALKTNAAQPSFALPAALPVVDEDGQPIYYRFKVDVENSSGLLNLLDAPITVNLAGMQ